MNLSVFSIADSYSGLKSQTINYLHNSKQRGEEVSPEDLCKTFQDAAVEHVMGKTKLAIEEFQPNTVIICGGVSANSEIREQAKTLHKNVIIPEMKYTTDNGAMVAYVG